MARMRRIAGIALLVAGGTVAAGAEGIWEGVLKVGPQEVRLVLRIENAHGVLSGTLDLPEKSLEGLAIDTVTLDETRFFFDFTLDRAQYRGTLDEDDSAIEGTWHQAGQELPLTFRKITVAPEMRVRPQTPRAPFPYRSEDISFEAAGKITLAGTLTIPAGEGRRPAVVLLSVAGPNDRDQSFAGHRSFHVLADYLSRRGIAVLRTDDRGVGGSGGELYGSTYEDFAEDALAAVRWLRARPDIDPNRVGLMGMSEGAGVASLAASRSDNVAFVVMLSGMGLRGDDAIAGQLAALSRLAGYTSEQVDSVVERARAIWSVLGEEPDAEIAGERITAIVEQASLAAPAAAQLTAPGDTEAQSRLYTSPWYRYQVAYDPAPVLAALDCPILALSGSLDPILPPAQNLPAIHQALHEGNHADFTIAQLPGLNHLLQPATTGMPIEYAQIDETIAPVALETIFGWVHLRFGD